MKKKLVVLIMAASMAMLAGCGSDLSQAVEDGKKNLEDQMEYAKENKTIKNGQTGLLDDSSNDSDTGSSQQDKKYQIGDTVKMETKNGAKISLTLTDWGSEYDSFLEKTSLYVGYEIENIGDIPFTVTDGIFTIYADDYSIGSTLGDDTVAAQEISAGRKVSGRTYGNIDPNTVNALEVEVGGICIYVLKGETAASGENNEFDTEISGNYIGTGNPDCTDELNVYIYSDPESDEIGNINLLLYGDQYNGGRMAYEVEIYKFSENVYYGRTTAGDEIKLEISYNEQNEEYEIYVVVNNERIEETFVRV